MTLPEKLSTLREGRVTVRRRGCFVERTKERNHVPRGTHNRKKIPLNAQPLTPSSQPPKILPSCSFHLAIIPAQRLQRLS